MTRDEFTREWGSGYSASTEAQFVAALDALLDSVRTETRAALLADEERRVWCEEYAVSRFRFKSKSTAQTEANDKLTAWREARAAWEARDGR